MQGTKDNPKREWIILFWYWKQFFNPDEMTSNWIGWKKMNLRSVTWGVNFDQFIDKVVVYIQKVKWSITLRETRTQKPIFSVYILLDRLFNKLDYISSSAVYSTS